MPRKVTPAQYNRMVDAHNRKLKQAVNKHNREVKRAIDGYNREARAQRARACQPSATQRRDRATQPPALDDPLRHDCPLPPEHQTRP
ncbi:hypothetical protein [Nonomuraea diastatica]|uniref:Uncharacterized protein n=1 Tax=Nonomuraea diastatica TaxID=1848329 RepID=A0A4R4WIT8_9ACTN|nr:hypothetical protein [Nonomuraea diastatica]TDD18912.1 hypothetical protein E1294_22565 [Nonomuraea diastatica]